jgi:hypothetical protein
MFAGAYAYRNEAIPAVAWLDKAVNHHDENLAGVPTDLPLANLGKDPRRLPFLCRIGNAPEPLAADQIRREAPG